MSRLKDTRKGRMPSLWGGIGTPNLEDGGSRQDVWEPFFSVLLLLCMLGIIFLFVRHLL